MKLLVGLGNPGREHENQRHNVGFMAVDRIRETAGFGPWRRKFRSLASEGRIDGEKVLLLKPQTWMNRSGDAVAEAVRFYKLAPEEVIVFHDELDLAPGRLRVKRGGGHAGHNGLRSIQSHIGADFWRVRIGIGHPGDKARVVGWVLGDFTRADAEWREPLLEAVAAEAPRLVAGDMAGFMNAVAARTAGTMPGRREKKPPKTPPAGQARKKEAPRMKGAEAGEEDAPATSPLERLVRRFSR